MNGVVFSSSCLVACGTRVSLLLLSSLLSIRLERKNPLTDPPNWIRCHEIFSTIQAGMGLNCLSGRNPGTKTALFTTVTPNSVCAHGTLLFILRIYYGTRNNEVITCEPVRIQYKQQARRHSYEEKRLVARCDEPHTRKSILHSIPVFPLLLGFVSFQVNQRTELDTTIQFN